MKTSLVKFCLLVTACLLTARWAGAESTNPTSPKPNIIIVLFDDAGYSDLGSYGGEIDTPHLDKLAQDGMRFRQFYNNGRCSPSRASLITGKEAALVGFGAGTLGGWNREIELPAYRARLPYNIPTLPELLKEAGYKTLMAGKWHLGGSNIKEGVDKAARWEATHPGWALTPEQIESEYQALPAQRGFDRFFGIVTGETHQFLVNDADLRGSKSSGATFTDNEYMENNKPAKLAPAQEYSIVSGAKKEKHPADGKRLSAWYAADGTTQKAMEMISEETKEGKPFFLYLSYQSPHAPLEAPQELVDKYVPRYKELALVEASRVKGLVAKKILPENTPYQKTFANDPGVEVKGTKKDDRISHAAAVHAAMVEKVDENVGRLVSGLKEKGLYDNTLIFVLSDNGAASEVGDLMNKPYRGCKALLWEGGPKTFFIASWPNHIPPNSYSDSMGWIGDLLPTCLEIAGKNYPTEFRQNKLDPLNSRSLLPSLLGKPQDPPNHFFLNDKGQQGVISKGRWKLLINPGWYAITSKAGKINYELYDLQTDPCETNNIAATQTEMVKELSIICQNWQSQQGIKDYGELLKIRPDFSK